mmetsp:Transcript_27611/g.60729  ORF Transcript_27611/g.60729 Transcript_27611/m.60729 type:complete len:547 (+) Transcript_27611:295-1935(+)
MQDYSVQLWDLSQRTLIRNMKGHRNWVTDVAFSPDQVHVASASADKTVKVWNIKDGVCRLTLEGHILCIAGIAFSDEATRIASASWDKSVCLWDPYTGALLKTLTGHTDWVHGVAWAPGGRTVASASSDHSVRIWDVISGAAVQVLAGHLQTVCAVSFSRCGVFLASGGLDSSVRIWNVQEGTLAAKLEQASTNGGVNGVAFAPDLSRVAIACDDKILKVWNFRTAEIEASLQGHQEGISGVCISADGMRVVSTSHDRTVKVWKMPPKVEQSKGLQKALRARGNQRPFDQPRPAGISNANSLKDLHDQLRQSEELNKRLRRHLLEVQDDIKERHGVSAVKEPVTAVEQERQLSKVAAQLASFEDVITSLTAERDALEKSVKELQKDKTPQPSGQLTVREPSVIASEPAVLAIREPSVAASEPLPAPVSQPSGAQPKPVKFALIRAYSPTPEGLGKPAQQRTSPRSMSPARRMGVVHAMQLSPRMSAVARAQTMPLPAATPSGQLQTNLHAHRLMRSNGANTVFMPAALMVNASGQPLKQRARALSP